jgi:hypothetical protein
MIRKVNVLGLATVAVLAMGALLASAAQAGTLETETGGSVLLHGEQVENSHVFTLTDNGNLTTTCTGATFSAVGETANGSSTIESHPEYSGCTAFGLSATITTTGCNYLFHIGEETGAGEFGGTVDIKCGTGAIVITAGTCEVKVGTQSGLNSGTATDSGGAGNLMDILLHSNTTNIHYTVTKDGFLCPLSGTGNFTQSDYTGTTTIRCYHTKVEPANQTGCTLKK